VPWKILFNDTEYIRAGRKAREFYGNNYPKKWRGGDSPQSKLVKTGTSCDSYEPAQRLLFDMPMAQALAKSMQDSLSTLVLSYLTPLRSQYSKIGLHLCTHVRQGNNEAGDWESKEWRHIDLMPVLRGTLSAMASFAETRGAQDVTVFVASDNAAVRPWFGDNAPEGWRVIASGKEFPKPESGVWFGEHGSKTNAVLNRTQKYEAMASAVADVLALGECDALFIPNYSSFNLVGIILARYFRHPVFFLQRGGSTRYLELPYSLGSA